RRRRRRRRPGCQSPRRVALLRPAGRDVPELVDDVPASALAVYAHPDDAEVSCGGTLARWAAAGARVYLLLCPVRDKGSIAPSADPTAIAELRSQETADAAAVLNLAGLYRLGYPDGELDNTIAVRGAIAGLVRQLKPDAVVCPDPTAVFFGDRYF